MPDALESPRPVFVSFITELKLLLSLSTEKFSLPASSPQFDTFENFYATCGVFGMGGLRGAAALERPFSPFESSTKCLRGRFPVE